MLDSRRNLISIPFVFAHQMNIFFYILWKKNKKKLEINGIEFSECEDQKGNELGESRLM